MYVRWRAPLATVLVAVSAGCVDRIGHRHEANVPAQVGKPSPTIDPTRLYYDSETRTLHLYELIADPESGRKAAWEVRLPDRTVVYASGKTIRLPEGVTEDDVIIRAYDPPGPPSPSLRLAAVPRKRPG